MPHKTPRSLNDSLRLGRLTAPQWAACVVAGASLWVCSGLASSVRDLNAHLLAVVLPTMLLVIPILILWRGGVERYPAQLLRFTVRRAVVYATRAGRHAVTIASKGGSHARTYAHTRVQAARRRQG